MEAYFKVKLYTKYIIPLCIIAIAIFAVVVYVVISIWRIEIKHKLLEKAGFDYKYTGYRDYWYSNDKAKITNKEIENKSISSLRKWIKENK